MPTTRHPRISFGWSNNLTWIILLLALLETGCGGGGSGAGSGGGTAPGFSGAIFGGSPQSPIKNSVVTLLAMAYDGYGQSPTQLAQTISSTNGTFSFTGTYSCPVAKPAAQTYIVASGGDATGQE